MSAACPGSTTIAPTVSGAALGWCGAQTPDHVIVSFGPNATAVAAAVDKAQKAGKTAEEVEAVRKEAEKTEINSFAVVDASRILTILYFGFFFVVMPLLGWKEKPLPLPESISKAVLGKSGAITGYHWGLTRKRAMLGWEAAKVAG